MSQWEGPPPGPHSATEPPSGAPDYSAPPAGPSDQGWHQPAPGPAVSDQQPYGQDQQFVHDQQYGHDQQRNEVEPTQQPAGPQIPAEYQLPQDGIDPQYRIDPEQLAAPAELPYEAYPSAPGQAGFGAEQAGYSPEYTLSDGQSWQDTDDFSAYGVAPGQPGVGTEQAQQAIVHDVHVQQPDARVPRYGQLSYTSFDTPGRPAGGGWQVQDSLGELDERETGLLRDQVSTQFDAGVELPQFPTPDQVADLPRRMVHAPLGADASAIWHSAPAGTDASGRPGNVFAQMLLDRTRRVVEGPRPIELWRSPDWRTPFGAEAVRETALGADLPRSGGVVTPTAVADFVLDPQAFRLPVLSVLLDACRRAMAGGPPVALVCETIDHGALWVGAVTYLMSPEQSRQFFFSTLERANGLPAAFARGVHLACVPAADADAAGRDTTHVVISESGVPQLGDPGATPHVTARGDRVEVTPWSGLAQVVLANVGGLTDIVAEADRIAAQVHGAQPASGEEDPLWASSLAVVQLGDPYREAHDEAAEVLAAGAPPALGDHTELLRLTEATVLGHVAATTAGAWTAAENGAGTGVVSALLARTYLERAVQDLEWLTQERGVPAPPRETCRAADLTTARAGATTMANDLADMAAADPGTVGLATIRLSDLVSTTGITDGTLGDELDEALGEVLRATVVPALFGADAGAFVRRIGPLGPATLDRVRQLVSQAEQFPARPVGQRLQRDVLVWLFPTGSGVDLPTSTHLTGVDRLRGEVAAHLASQLPTMRPLATWTSLAEGADLRTIAPWFTAPWPIDALQPLLDTFGDRLPSDLWLGTVKASPNSPRLTAFCQQVVGTTWSPSPYAGQAVVPVAELRLLDETWWQREHPGADVTTGVIGGSAAQTAPGAQFDPTAERHVQLAMIMAVLDPQVLTAPGAVRHLDALAPLLDGRPVALPEAVWDAIASYASRVRTPDLIAGLASTDPDLDVGSTSDQARWTWLAKITHGDVGLVRSLVTHRLTGQDAPHAGAVVDQLKELPTRQPVADQRGRERQLAAWVKDLLPARERGLGRLFGGAG